MFKRILVLGPAALLAAACGTDRPHPTAVAVASTATVAFSAVKFWEAGATVSWNQLATDLAVAAPAPGINAARLYAYLALAQFRAAEAAQAAPGPHPPIAAAIGGASVAVLSSFLPSSHAATSARVPSFSPPRISCGRLRHPHLEALLSTRRWPRFIRSRSTGPKSRSTSRTTGW